MAESKEKAACARDDPTINMCERKEPNYHVVGGMAHVTADIATTCSFILITIQGIAYWGGDAAMTHMFF